MISRPPRLRRPVLDGVVAGLVLAVVGCAAACSEGTAATAPAGPEVTVTDQWVRATDGVADPSMTTVFGTFINHTGHRLTIVAATNSVSRRTELHRMTMTGDVMVMGPAVGGLELPAQATTTLDPNSAHIMLMDLRSAIEPGDDVTVHAALDDGTTVTFDALAKDYAGGNESYPASGSRPPAMAPMTTPSR